MISNERRRELYRRKKEFRPEAIARKHEQTRKWKKDHPEKAKEYQVNWRNKIGDDVFKEIINNNVRKYRSRKS